MLLADSTLHALITGPSKMVTDFPRDVDDHLQHNPFGPNSPIQASSVDLHVGDIQLPLGVEQAQDDHLERHFLPPGFAVLVASHESFNMPKDVGACAYPLAGRRQAGILMLNPGHIDPGYSGKLWFSFINVGREPIEIRRGLRIATVLFWSTSGKVNKHFVDRHGIGGSPAIPPHLVREISGDTLMVGDRAREVALEIANENKAEMERIRDEAKNTLLHSKVWATVLPALIVAVVGFFMMWANNEWGTASRNREDISNAKQEMIKLRAESDSAKDRVSKLEPLDQRIRDIQNQLQTGDTRDRIAKVEDRVKLLESPNLCTCQQQDETVSLAASTLRARLRQPFDEPSYGRVD